MASSVYPQPQPLQALLDTDPYVSLGRLGSGAYGYVDKVQRRDQPGTVYARKTVRITGQYGRSNLEAAQNEARVIRRLKHRHVISILELYTHRNTLSIIMLEVADCDLENYMDLVDDMEMGDERRKLSEPMMRWPGCLIQATDYLHEMRIKHKDLKPANILVKDGQVIITDFGIAKDLIDEDTTRSLKMNGLQGTPTYMAPEISAGTHRGRAVDIFALGCVFLEIATILLIGPGSLKRFAKFRETGNSRAYASCPLKLSQWIWHLRTYTHCCFRDFADLKPDYIRRTEMTSVAYRLAFLMLDPNPQTRITARQMVTLIHSKIFARNLTIKSYACEHCVNGQTIEQSNLPLHSVFTPQVYLKYPDSPESALEQSLGESWEEVKTSWLESHMWWDQEKQLQLKRRRLEQRQQEQLQREQLQQEQYRLEQLQLERLMIFRREEQRIRENNPLIPHQRAYAYERERLRLQEEPHP